MTFATRGPLPLLPLALIAAMIVSSGCRDKNGADVTPADFVAKTSGTTDELSQHLGLLDARYAAANPSSPAVSREILLAFTSAVIKTTDALMADPKTDPDIRSKALRFQFIAYGKRKEVEPKAEDEMLAAAARIEAANPKSELAIQAAKEVVRLLGQKAERPVPTLEEHRKRYEALTKALVHVATMEPTPPDGPLVLDHHATDCEQRNFFDLAIEADRALVKYYPDDPLTKFAVGAIHRHDLKGKPIDDLVGKDFAGKPISIKDYRGKVALVVFWIASHEPSANEVMEVEKFRKKYDPKDFEVLGVSLEANTERVQQFLNEMKIPWPQIDSKLTPENLESELTLRYGIRAVAYKFVVDREGKLVDFGYILEHVRPTLDKLLPKPIEKAETPQNPASPKAK